VLCCQPPLREDSIQAGPRQPGRSDGQLGGQLRDRVWAEIWGVPGQARWRCGEAVALGRARAVTLAESGS